MELNTFNAICKEIFSLNKHLPHPADEQIEKLYTLTAHMLEVNRSMNLTAIKDEKAIILRHYADSLAISEHLAQTSVIIDVGCGAGFPTLPLAIFRPDLKITAIDSTSKRIEYVKATARLLDLNNVTAIAERAEVLGKSNEYREKFDYATARAVASLPVLTELCLPFVRIGGKFIAMKAQKAGEELATSHNAISACGGSFKEEIHAPLTDTDGSSENRIIIIVSKSSPTPTSYPRHFSKISKKPL